MTGRRVDEDVSVEDALATLAPHDYVLIVRRQDNWTITSVAVDEYRVWASDASTKNSILQAIMKIHEALP